jgi:hypothetical protein
VVPIYFSKKLCGRYKIASTDHPDFIGDNVGAILYRLPITVRWEIVFLVHQAQLIDFNAQNAPNAEPTKTTLTDNDNSFGLFDNPTAMKTKPMIPQAS